MVRHGGGQTTGIHGETIRMALEIIRIASEQAASPEDVWDWHARPGAMSRLLPPWERIEVVRADPGLAEGTRVTVRMGWGPCGVEWVSEHLAPDPPHAFADCQVEGPFARWRHRHLFSSLEGGGCEIEDRVEYELPLEPLAGLVAGRRLRDRIERGLAYRHRVLSRDFERHRRAALRPGLRVAVSGASGMIGGELSRVLSTAGHEPVALERPASERPGAAGASIAWDIGAGTIDRAALEGLDAVVHLAGEPIAGDRWTPERKERILDSRVEGTRLLSEALAALENPPDVLVCASAIGLYGDRGDVRLEETAAPGDGVLPRVVRAWEEAADPARDAGIRVVHLRLGLVLWPAGGALERLLLPMRAGLGGRLGDGRQVWSWVTLDDVIGVALHVIGHDDVSGPVNVTAPNPVSNAEFTAVLARVLNRPAFLPAPAVALRTLLGPEMADELLLASARAAPAELERTGYAFTDPVLEPALRHMLGR
ncbi:MAG: TIGR01777 family oxidoreductase [Gemmatimonadota bacterium]